VAEEWVEPRCILIRKNRGRRLRETDAVPFFSGAVALRAGAAAAIASEIVECGEMLGVRLPPGEKEQLVVFHVTKVIDALDVARAPIRLKAGSFRALVILGSTRSRWT
jgi:hypothetical protein